MILQLDTKVIEENKLSLDEFIFILNLVTDKELFQLNDNVDVRKNLEEKLFIKLNKEEVQLRYKALECIKIIETKDDELNDFDTFIKNYRDLFKGKKPGVMGDSKSIAKKMTEFLLQYPQFSNLQILQATEAYINSCAKDRYRFLQRADYFIFKTSDGTKSGNVSNLANWCEEIIENPIDKSEPSFINTL